MRTARLLVPLTTLALLAGCSGDPEEAEPTPEPTQAEDVRVKEAPEPGEDEPADDAADGPDGDLAACILGEWWSDPNEAAAMADALTAAMGMSSTTVVTGDTYTTFDATTVSTTYLDQVTEMTMTIEGQTIASTTRMNGTMSQPYTLDGDVMTSMAGDMSGVEVESSVLVNGQHLPEYDAAFQEGMGTGGTPGQSGRTRVTCSGDTMTLTTLDLAALGLDEIVVTATRR